MEIPQPARDDTIDEEHPRLLSIGRFVAALNPEMFSAPGQSPQGSPDGMMEIFAVVIGSADQACGVSMGLDCRFERDTRPPAPRASVGAP